MALFLGSQEWKSSLMPTKLSKHFMMQCRPHGRIVLPKLVSMELNSYIKCVYKIKLYNNSKVLCVLYLNIWLACCRFCCRHRHWHSQIGSPKIAPKTVLANWRKSGVLGIPICDSSFRSRKTSHKEVILTIPITKLSFRSRSESGPIRISLIESLVLKTHW